MRRFTLFLMLAIVGFAGGCFYDIDDIRLREGSSAVYDPENDPLVNPDQMFEPVPEDLSQVSRDETFVRQLDGNPRNLNPVFSSSIQESIVSGLLFDSLFLFDDKMQWFVNESMVEHYEESEDHLVSTVVLRPGLKWQDGAPFTAEDIRFSWEIILSDQVAAPAVKVGTDQIDDVVVVDERTVQFVHKEALPTNTWNMLFPVIPKHIYGKPDELEKDPTINSSPYYNRHNREVVIGNGPYRLVEWVTNDRIVVERWEDYHGPKPHFRRQILRITPDNNVALLSFKKGDLDEFKLSAKQFATQTSDEDFARVGHKALGSEWGFGYIGWNMDGSNPFFTDRRVRRAMAHAFNYDLIREAVSYNLPTRCYGIYHPDSPMFNPTIELIEYDLEQADQLLTEAGWEKDPRNGRRFKIIDNRRVDFDFTLSIPMGASSSELIAAIYAQDLRRLGITMRTRVIEWATFGQMMLEHDFQAAIAGWGTGTDPDTGWNLWRTEMYDRRAHYGVTRTRASTNWFEQGRTISNHEQRMKIYAEIQKLIYDDQPYLFMFNTTTLWAVHKRIRGLQFSPRGLFGFYPGESAWWVHTADALR